MFGRSDILSVRKDARLSRVWLAATVSKRLFKQSVSDRILMSINIGSTCEQIIKMAFFTGTQRYSLYLSAQLMYGTVKLLNYQVELFEKSLCKIQRELNAIYIVPTKKSRPRSSRSIDPENFVLPALPPVDDQTLFGDIGSKIDSNLLLEAYSAVVGNDEGLQPDLLTFGEITDDERGFFEGVFGDLQQALGSVRHRSSDMEELIASPPRLIDLPDVPEDIQPPVIDANQSSIVEAPAKTFKTPQKRGSMSTANADTPTKRRRKNLGPSFEEVAAEQTEIPQASNTAVDMEANDPVQAPEYHQEETTTENNDLLLDNLIPLPPRRRTRKRNQSLIVDESTRLTNRTQQINNVQIYTRPGPLSLLRGTTLKFQTSAEEFLKTPSVRSVNWARALRNQYKANTVGPFTVESYEEGRGTFRVADLRTELAQPPSAEISSGLEIGRDTTTSRSKAIDDTNEHADRAPIEKPSTTIPYQSTEENRGQPLDTDVPIIENIEVADTADIGQQIEPSNHTEAQNRALETSRRNSNDSNESFLPRNPPVVLPPVVPASPSSLRSEDSVRGRQTMSDLMNCLETHWTSDEEVTFKKIAPPETCTDVEAGTLFLLALDLSWEGKIILSQEVQGGEIKISRA